MNYIFRKLHHNSLQRVLEEVRKWSRKLNHEQSWTDDHSIFTGHHDCAALQRQKKKRSGILQTSAAFHFRASWVILAWAHRTRPSWCMFVFSLSGCNWLQTNEDGAQREAGLDGGCFALTLIRANWRNWRPVRPLRIHRVLPDNRRVTKLKTNQLFSVGAENWDRIKGSWSN